MRTAALGPAEPPQAAISPDGVRSSNSTSASNRRRMTPTTPMTRGRVSAEQQTADRARPACTAAAERVAAERRFHALIEHELTAELRALLHLTVCGTTATCAWHSHVYTLTVAGFVERTETTPAGGLAAYTLRAWCITCVQTGRVRNIAEGELQVGLLAYLGLESSR